MEHLFIQFPFSSTGESGPVVVNAPTCPDKAHMCVEMVPMDVPRLGDRETPMQEVGGMEKRALTNYTHAQRGAKSAQN